MTAMSTIARRVLVTTVLYETMRLTKPSVVKLILDYDGENLGVLLIPIDRYAVYSNQQYKQRRPRLYVCMGQPTTNAEHLWCSRVLSHLTDPIEASLVRYNRHTSTLLTVHVPTAAATLALFTFTNIDTGGIWRVCRPFVPFCISTCGRWFMSLARTPNGIEGYMISSNGSKWIDMKVPIVAKGTVRVNSFALSHGSCFVIRLLPSSTDGRGYQVTIDPGTLNEATEWKYTQTPRRRSVSHHDEDQQVVYYGKRSYQFSDTGTLLLTDHTTSSTMACAFPHNRGDFVYVVFKC